MKFKELRKVYSGRWFDRYDTEYYDKDGIVRLYEYVSRDHAVMDLSDLANRKAHSVDLILTDESGEKILLNKEFRIACGTSVYGFPSGLIERREEAADAAKRVLKDETGLDLLSVDETLGISASAFRFSNDQDVTVLGKAGGTIQNSDNELKQIEAAFYTKAEVRELLANEFLTTQAQAYLYLWSKE